MAESSVANIHASASLQARNGIRTGAFIENYIHTKHYRPEDPTDPNSPLQLIWEDVTPNTMCIEGLQELLQNAIKGGTAEPTWYILLKGTGTALAADTYSSHGSWSEITPYSNATRPTWVPGAISGSAPATVDNASGTNFLINATGTVYGAALVSNMIKSNTASSGTSLLYGAGDFSGGSRPVLSADVLTITITATTSN